jgi:AcrR family transcriptional regulator
LTTRARREREKEERRQSILQAARETFFEEGFYRATVDSVAERAEVSKGTVYLYFDSKEALLAALLLEGLDTLLQTLEAACPPDEPLAAEERLQRIGWAYLQFFHHEPQYFRLLVAMSRGRFRDTVTPELYQEVLEASMEGLDYVVKAVEQGVAEGTFACCDARQAAAVLWATLNGILELMDHPLRQEMVGVKPEVLYHAAMDTVIRGLRYNPTGPDRETAGGA